MTRFNRRQFLAAGLAATAASVGRALRAGTSADKPIAPRAIRYQDERHFDITHRGLFRNGSLRLDSVEIWIPVPQDDLQQTVQSPKTRPHVPVARDVNGLAAVAKLYKTQGLPPPGATVSLEVSYQLTARAAVPDWDVIERVGSLSYQTDRQYRLFTRAETKIESDHPAIVRQAQRLRETANTPLAVARAAYDWVIDHTEYRLLEGFRGAAYCLENGQGECGEYSALFVALCRAAKVPARVVSGFLADKTDGWHCWAEFMLPSGDWIPVDPTHGDHRGRARKANFGSLDNCRVALCRTADIELAGSHGGHHQSVLLQSGTWWWRGQYVGQEHQSPETQFHVEGRESWG